MSIPTSTPSPLAARIRQLPYRSRLILATALGTLVVLLMLGPATAFLVGWWRFYFTPQGPLETMAIAMVLTGLLWFAVKPHLPRIQANIERVHGSRGRARATPFLQFVGWYGIVWFAVALAYFGGVRWTVARTDSVYEVARSDDCTRRCNFCREQFQVKGWPGTPMAHFCADALPSTLRPGDRVQFTLQANDRAIYVHDVTIVQ